MAVDQQDRSLARADETHGVAAAVHLDLFEARPPHGLGDQVDGGRLGARHAGRVRQRCCQLDQGGVVDGVRRRRRGVTHEVSARRLDASRPAGSAACTPCS